MRAFSCKTGAMGTPKGGKSRDVDMNGELIVALRRWKVQQAEKSLREGRGGELPTRVFPMLTRKSGARSPRSVVHGPSDVGKVFVRLQVIPLQPQRLTKANARHEQEQRLRVEVWLPAPGGFEE